VPFFILYSLFTRYKTKARQKQDKSRTKARQKQDKSINTRQKQDKVRTEKDRKHDKHLVTLVSHLQSLKILIFTNQKMLKIYI
jgi:hypothetical protein